MRTVRNAVRALFLVALVVSFQAKMEAMSFIQWANTYYCDFLPSLDFNPPSWWVAECHPDPEGDCENDNPSFCEDYSGACSYYCTTYYGTQMEDESCNPMACAAACTCVPKNR